MIERLCKDNIIIHVREHNSYYEKYVFTFDALCMKNKKSIAGFLNFVVKECDIGDIKEEGSELERIVMDFIEFHNIGYCDYRNNTESKRIIIKENEIKEYTGETKFHSIYEEENECQILMKEFLAVFLSTYFFKK